MNPSRRLAVAVLRVRGERAASVPAARALGSKSARALNPRKLDYPPWDFSSRTAPRFDLAPEPTGRFHRRSELRDTRRRAQLAQCHETEASSSHLGESCPAHRPSLRGGPRALHGPGPLGRRSGGHQRANSLGARGPRDGRRASSTNCFTLTEGRPGPALPAVNLVETASSITVTTGPARFEMSKTRGSLLEAA